MPKKNAKEHCRKSLSLYNLLGYRCDCTYEIFQYHQNGACSNSELGRCTGGDNQRTTATGDPDEQRTAHDTGTEWTADSSTCHT